MPVLPKRIVQQLKPYPKPDEGRYPLVRLDFNENTSGYPAAYPKNMPPTAVSAYPEYGQLSQRIGALHNLPADWVMLTNGSDEGIHVVAHTFVEPGEDSAVVSEPCFMVIPHSLLLAGATLRSIPAHADLSFDLEGIEKALALGAKIAFFASPENPTGVLLPLDTVRGWCKKFPQTLFALDEAYGEFTDQSMIPFLQEFDNLLVLRTFSKAWGMAGLRLGVVLANPTLIKYMNTVRLPYSVNTAAVHTANQLLDRQAEVRAAVKAIMTEKEHLVMELKSRGFRLDVGHSNSILLNAGINAQPLTAFCKSQGVLVRNRSQLRFPEDMNGKRQSVWGRVRVSVGQPDESTKLLQAIDRFNESYAVVFDLDGTIIDVSTSYDRTVAELVERHSGKPLTMDDLQALRQEGGFNDDWVAVVELLKRRGKTVSLEQITDEAVPRYFEIAKDAEKLMCDPSVLDRLGKRHPLFVVTGRTRREYEEVWGERLAKYFRRVLCLYDLPAHKQPKPSPDYLHHLLSDCGLKAGAYVGNAVDDMQAARGADLDAIGVSTTQPASVLLQAGAQITIPSVDSLAEVFML